MMKPLDLDLNHAVVAMARKAFPEGFDVSPTAPDTLDKLNALLNAGHRMAVYDGGSDATIFASAFVNYCFRAWHDFHHWTGDLPFTPEGEAEACRRQCQNLLAFYGDNALTRQWCKVLDCEINGQLAYASRHNGSFPVDQMAFALAYLKAPQAALASTF